MDRFKALALSFEKFLAIDVNIFKFLDSCQFLKSALDRIWSLVKEMTPDNDFSIIKQSALVTTNGVFDQKKYDLICANKGVYPYDYISSYETLDEESLPSKSEFFSKLKDSEITEESYDYACDVFSTFKCQNLTDFTSFYVQADTLLLVQIWFNFRKFCNENYTLYPEHFLTLPSICFRAALKKSKVELELLQKPEMYSFFEQALKGGFCSEMQKFMISRLTEEQRTKVGREYDDLVK